MILYLIGQITTDGGAGYCHRVHGRSDPRPVDGKADDGLQHVDRRRRAGRHDRAGRDDLRLPPRPAAFAPQGADFDKAVARWRAAADRCRREVRQVARLRGGRHRAASHLGHESRPSRAGHRPRCPTRPSSAIRTSRRRPPVRSNTWASTGGDADHRSEARPRVHRLVHQRPHRRPAGRRRRGQGPQGRRHTSTRWSCPAAAR